MKIKCILPEFLHIKVTGQDRGDQQPCRDCYIRRIVKYDISTFWDMPPHFHIPRRPHYPVMSRPVSDVWRDLDSSYSHSWLLHILSSRSHHWRRQEWRWQFVIELQTKVIRRFAKISQSRRRPLLGPSPGRKRLRESQFHVYLPWGWRPFSIVS